MAVFQPLMYSLLIFGWIRNVNCSPIARASETQVNTGVTGDWIAQILQLIQTNPEIVEGLMNTKYTVLEGDMIMASDDRNAVEKLWPNINGNVTVPFTISPDIVGRTDEILVAIGMVSESTCVSFHQRSTEHSYIHFKVANGCASYVGQTGGKQDVYIGPKCKIGNICHEILHALGFQHEHTRKDRDNYVKIIFTNIIKGRERNFIIKKGNTLGLNYDKTSILHYGSTFFSVNGKPTIVSTETEKEMGQRTRMTEMDTERVRRLYKCGAREGNVTEENAGENVTEENAGMNQTITESTGNQTAI